MAPMSTPEETSVLLANLEAGRQTGCLTIESADGRVCRVYILMGKVFHAEGPAAEGEPALADATSWPDVSLSFDAKAGLPEKQTINAVSSPASAVSRQAADEGRFPLLSNDQRVTGAQLVYIGAGCLWGIVILLGVAAAVAAGAWHWQLDEFFGVLVVLVFATGLLWLILYWRYRFVFRTEAVRVPGGLGRAEIPRVVEAPAGVIRGEPELVVTLSAHYLGGRLGKCRVEFYAAGVQISRGREHPEPRWQFSYQDLLQAESVVLEASGGRNSRDQYAFRLIAAQPRMAFLFGNSLTDRDPQLMLTELRKHGVRTFTEG